MADYDERVAYINQTAEAKGYRQDYVDFLRDCAEWTDDSQWRWICFGLDSGVDVSTYADPKFDWKQMAEIELGLRAGINVSKYADPKFDHYQMYEIREGLKSGVNISEYADPELDWWQMAKVRERLEAEKN